MDSSAAVFPDALSPGSSACEFCNVLGRIALGITRASDCRESETLFENVSSYHYILFFILINFYSSLASNIKGEEATKTNIKARA